MNYMLDFWGRAEESSEEDMKKALETMDFKDALARKGALPQAVEAWCQGKGLSGTLGLDRGFGGDQWHVGIPIETFVEAAIIFSWAETVFAEAIKRKWLRMKLMNGWHNDDEPKKNQEGQS